MRPQQPRQASWNPFLNQHKSTHSLLNRNHGFSIVHHSSNTSKDERVVEGPLGRDSEAIYTCMWGQDMAEKTIRWRGRGPLWRIRARRGARDPVRTLKAHRLVAKRDPVEPVRSPLARRFPLRLKSISERRAMAVGLAGARSYGETVQGPTHATSCIASGGRRSTLSNNVRGEGVGTGKAPRGGR